MREFKYLPPRELADTTHSIGKILSWIAPDSRVLECGSASGYTTQYLKEQLNCAVYIVEIDRDSFEQAMNYAVDGICTDLMEYEWTRAFKGMQFDYILFVDVLEHVYDPGFVLTRATALLKSDGEILVSLPNVTNNDIIAKMYTGHFDYTKTGLLDETHIRFFGPHNLEAFFNASGLGIARFDYTVKTLLGSEQLANSDLLDKRFVEALAGNSWGSVYQFLISLRKKASMASDEYAVIEPPKEAMMLSANLFYASGDASFVADDRVSFDYPYGVALQASIDLTGFKATRVRFDPVERMSCLVKNVRVLADGVEIDLSRHNGLRVPSGIVFETKDPQLFFDVPCGVSQLEVYADVTPLFGNDSVELMHALRDCESVRVSAVAKANSEKLAAESAAAEGMNRLSALLEASERDAAKTRELAAAENEEHRMSLAGAHEQVEELKKKNEALKASIASSKQKNEALKASIASSKQENASMWWTFKHFWYLLARKLHLR